MDGYYEVNHGWMVQREYPVWRSSFYWITQDSSLVRKEEFLKKEGASPSYSYLKKGDGIFIQYYNAKKKKKKLTRLYSLTMGDTVRCWSEGDDFNYGLGLSFYGLSTYLGQDIIEINGKKFNTFRFLELHPAMGADDVPYKVEVFLEQGTLIPIRFVIMLRGPKMILGALYRTVITLAYSTNRFPDYSGKTDKDMVIYENENTTWTDQQKQRFLSMFPDMKTYAECLLKKLDGHVSFFHFERSFYFKKLFASPECHDE